MNEAKIIELQPLTKSLYINLYRENVNIILYVANETEYSETLDFLISHNSKIVKFIHNDNLYHVGSIGLYTVALVKGGTTGQDGVFSSSPTIDNALKTFYNTEYLITVGVCGGFQEKVRVGDVIVAYEMINYESQKVSDGKIINRSHGLISAKLGSILSSSVSAMKFGTFSVHYGKVLSGSKLVSDKDFCNKLLELHPDVLGLDMEGYSIARIAITHKLSDWIFIKSPSDYLHNKNGSSGQDVCTRNALSVLEKLLNSDQLFAKRRIKVLVSGSYVSGDVSTKLAEEVSYKLTKSLIDSGYKVVSGYGRCIGNAVVAGAYESFSHLQNSSGSINDLIDIYPFPRLENELVAKCLTNIKFKNRLEMLKGCSFSIFLYGKKENDQSVTGMEAEFGLAQNCFVIPIGATGNKAKELWDRVKKDIGHYYPDDNSVHDGFKLLCESGDVDTIVRNTLKFMEIIKDYYFQL